MATSAATDTRFSRNTPRGLADGEISQIPSAYSLDEFKLINQYGSEYDIRNLVQSFSIVEELFSPIIVFNARLHDTINFFEDFGIFGQELVKITIRKNDGGSRESVISLNLTVKEYPNYVKTTESLDAQDYDMIAVSDFAYLSMLQRISRSVKGNPVKAIRKILKDDLKIKKVRWEADGGFPCVSNFDGIITTQSPLKATEWLRSKALDNRDAPFFIYKNIAHDYVTIRSWSSIINAPQYPNDNFTYEYKKFIAGMPYDLSSYGETMKRILSMRSNIKLDKLKQATSGGFANKTEATDFRVKTFVQKVFKYEEDDEIKKNRLERFNKTLKGTAWADAVSFLTNTPVETLTNGNASISQVQTQTGSNNTSDILSQAGGRVRSYLANLESESHEIEVYGDFNLSPGRKISISIPKSVNINQYENENPDANIDVDVDERLSGTYIVAVSVHTFNDGVYTTRAKIIRDNS